MKMKIIHSLVLMSLALATPCFAATESSLSPKEAQAIAKEGYLYGFPVVDSSRVQHAYFVDRDNPGFKANWKIEPL